MSTSSSLARCFLSTPFLIIGLCIVKVKKNPNELDLAIPFFNYYYALAVTVITSVIFVIKIVHGGGVHVKIKTLDINVRVFHTSLLFDGVGGGGKAEVD